MVTSSYVILSPEEFEMLRKKEIVVLDLSQIDDEVLAPVESVTEEKKTAVKMAFLGAGQGGGNLADTFYGLGYRRVAVVNTTTRDMQRLSVPEANRHVLKGDGGAGKDPAVGRAAVEAESEEIHRLIQSSFKKDVEQILICVGAGGGTGSGAALPLVKIAKEYMSAIGVQNPEKRVGVIVTLPTKDESSAVQRNALETLLPLLDMAEKGQLSPLVIVDNARVMQLYGTASVVDVWKTANKNIAALFSSFNELCAIDSKECHVVCDPKDYRTVLESGILSFGRTKLERIEKPTDVADAVRENVKKGLLVEGLDLSKAKVGAGLLVSNGEGLASVTQEALEGAFGSLNRLMAQGPETKLHRGVYEAGSQSTIYLFTILSGLGRPTARLQEMAAKSGSAYPIG
jgi:cell division GTPase FtsZ